MSDLHDFTSSRWGHALHEGTWRALDDARASFMVHCSPTPRPGDRAVYLTESGPKTVEILEVEHARNVHDMFTLTVKR